MTSLALLQLVLPWPPMSLFRKHPSKVTGPRLQTMASRLPFAGVGAAEVDSVAIEVVSGENIVGGVTEADDSAVVSGAANEADTSVVASEVDDSVAATVANSVAVTVVVNSVVAIVGALVSGGVVTTNIGAVVEVVVVVSAHPVTYECHNIY